MRKPLITVSADRLRGKNGSATEHAEHLGTFGMLHAAVTAKHDVLARLELHPADGAAWKLSGHWFTVESIVVRPGVYARPRSP